jgi:hypothetical protein
MMDERRESYIRIGPSQLFTRQEDEISTWEKPTFSEIFLLYFQLNDNTTDSRHQLDTYTHRCVCPICLKGCRSSSSLSFGGPFYFLKYFMDQVETFPTKGGPPLTIHVQVKSSSAGMSIYFFFFFQAFNCSLGPLWNVTIKSSNYPAREIERELYISTYLNVMMIGALYYRRKIFSFFF